MVREGHIEYTSLSWKLSEILAICCEIQCQVFIFVWGVQYYPMCTSKVREPGAARDGTYLQRRQPTWTHKPVVREHSGVSVCATSFRAKTVALMKSNDNIPPRTRLWNGHALQVHQKGRQLSDQGFREANRKTAAGYYSRLTMIDTVLNESGLFFFFMSYDRPPTSTMVDLISRIGSVLVYMVITPMLTIHEKKQKKNTRTKLQTSSVPTEPMDIKVRPWS